MSSLEARIRLDRGADFTLDVQLDIPLRGVTAVYGPSGSGKTSLLYCLAGLLSGSAETEIRFAGQLWQDGAQLLPSHQRQIGLVFQDARLFPHLTVAGNLAYASERRAGRSGPSLLEVCEWLKLENLMQRGPEQLSRGQQQRVAIARALLSAPRILLLDEPLANLDQSSRAEILSHLQRINRELAIPMLYVSHDMEELARLAEWLIVLECGRVSAQGPMIELCSRLELALAHEEQAAAIITATVTGHDTEFGLSQLDLDGQTMLVSALEAKPGSQLRLRVPARDISLCRQLPSETSILNIFKVQITEIEDSSSNRLLLRLQVGSQLLLARLTRKSIVALQLKPGDTVYAQIKSVALLSSSDD